MIALPSIIKIKRGRSRKLLELNVIGVGREPAVGTITIITQESGGKRRHVIYLPHSTAAKIKELVPHDEGSEHAA